MLIITSCDDLLSDYESHKVESMVIDDNICSILNEMESVTAYTSMGDSLSTIAYLTLSLRIQLLFLRSVMQVIGGSQLILCVILWSLPLSRLILTSSL